MPDNMVDTFNLNTTKNTFFIQARGLFKKSAQKDILNQMKTLINKHDYNEYYVLSQGEISRSIFRPRIETNAWVKFFETEEEYQQFIKTYDPFHKK